MKIVTLITRLALLSAGVAGSVLQLAAQVPTPNPTALTLSAPANSTAAASATLLVTGAAGQSWRVQSVGGFWLRFLVTPTCPASVNDCTTTNAGTTTITVLADPTGLPAFTYSGSITITYPTGTVTVPVNFLVGGASGNAALTATPSTLTFSGAPGSGAQSQVVAVTSSGATNTIFFSATSSVAWLTTNLDTGSTYAPNNLTITANATSLAAGTYQGNITLTATGGATPPVTIPVTFNVGVAQHLVVNPTSVTFNSVASAGVPVAVTVNSGANVPFSVSISYPGLAALSWLTSSVTTGTTGSTNVVLTPSGSTNLPAGVYSATVAIASPNLATVYIPVTLNLNTGGGTGPRLVADVNPVTLGVAPGGSASRTVVISTSTGATAPYNAIPQYTSPASPAVNWLSLTAATGTTPGTLTISANPGNLPVGSYTANIVVASSNATFASVTIPVTMNVSSGQIITYSPSSLNFSYVNGVPILSGQNIQLNLSPATPALPATLSIVYDVAGQSWLSASLYSSVPGSITTGSQIGVSVNGAGLPNGTYTAKVQISAPGAGNPLLQIPITLTMSGGAAGTLLTFSPTALNFSAALNGTAPDQLVTVSSSPTTGLSYTLSSNASWLTLVNSTGTTPGSNAVRINASGLVAGTYNGTITVSAPGASNSGTSIPVTLTVSGTASNLTASPALLTFAAQSGNVSPAPQTIQVTSPLSNVSYSVTTNQAWLQASPATGTTPGTISVYANSAGLLNGIYNGTVTVISGFATINIPVTLEVTSGALLRFSQQSVTFNYQTGQALPTAKAIVVTSSNGSALNASITASTSTGGNWLLATPATVQTPGSFAISLSPSVLPTLATGTYSGTVTVSAPGAPSSVIGVTLVVSAGSLLTVSTAPVSFNAELNGVAPPSQTRSITSTGAASPVLVSTSTNGLQGWLTAVLTSGVTPSTVTITANPAALAAGTYTGVVTLSGGVGTTAQLIPVTLNVNGAPTLNVDKSELIFAGATSTTPQTIQVSSTSGNYNYTVSTSVGNSTANWLTVNTGGGITPSGVTVSANPSLLTDGTYFGTVTITAQGLANTTPFIIPVTLLVNRATALQVNPTSLSFTQVRGAGLPIAQTLSVTSQQPVPFGYTSAVQTPAGGNWLNVSQVGSVTNGSLQVSLNSSVSALPVGNYTATITVFDANSGSSVPVTVNLAVVASSSLVATPNAITFTTRGGQTSPQSQTVAIASSVPSSPVSFNITSDAAWLNAAPLSGTTPANLTISVNTAALPAGSTNAVGHLTVVPLLGGQTITITVNHVTESGPPPVIASFANAATFQPGPLAPGMIFSIFGTNLGPATGLNGTVTDGRFTTSLSGVRVLLDGIPAPILFANATQINAVAPYQLFGRAFAQLTVEYNGVTSNTLAPRIADSSPGIFTASDGRQAAALNENGSINSASNPAAPGSIVVLYVTGEGQTTPGGVDGEVAVGTNLKRPLGAVRVRVNGNDVPASDIFYAGSAPGLVSGLMQINFRLPANAPSNSSTGVDVFVGTGQSPAGTTIAVR